MSDECGANRRCGIAIVCALIVCALTLLFIDLVLPVMM